MAKWLIEDGIGERRALLIEQGEVCAARLAWPDELRAGAVADGVLIARAKGSARGTARFPSGEEALVAGLPQAAQEGAQIRLKVVRSAIGEAGRYKRAQARPTEDAIGSAELPGRVVARFEAGLWEAVFEEAWSGCIAFAGGSLTLSPTPGMTVIDIDGDLPRRALALAAIPAIAGAIRRMAIGGNIGIDFPTLPDKPDRRAIDEALNKALGGWPHERTAMNGFGFVQLVARLEGPSLLQRLAGDRTGAAARALLRRAERVSAPGALLIVAHPLVSSAVRTEWRDALARRTGRALVWQDDARLALDGGFAQATSR